tara:strand:+ start:3372 stop:5780 length:2409 start_codon:yes stop_codon:yes gene_type:complete
MKKRVLILILLIANVALGQSKSLREFRVVPQELNGYTKLSYLEKIYSGAILLSSLSYTTEKPWIIYSDRKNNETMESPNSRRLFGRKLDFMQPLVVKEIEGTWLHVYIPFETINGRSNNEPVDAGWINVGNTIVSRYPVLTDQGASKKAMVLLSLEEGVLDRGRIDSVIYNLYNSPTGLEQYELGTSGIFKIYYILKESSRMELLTKTDKLGTNLEALQENVAGWMLTKNTTSWNSRLCLEPAFGPEVSNFNHKSAEVYKSRNSLMAWKNSSWLNTDGRVKSFDLSGTMMDPILMRLPILSTPEDNLSKTTRVATVGNVAGESISDSDKIKWKTEFNSLIKRQRNVNVVFVVDGTTSMKKYMKSIIESIQRIVDQNIDSGINSKLKFGGVVYRDYLDGEDAYDYFRLSTDKEALKEWFFDIDCKSKDDDLPEAQYNGILESLDNLGLQSDQSNIMILIGDAGNHLPDPKDKTLDQVVDAMSKYNFNLISFQVINDLSKKPYYQFNKDSRLYLYKLSKLVKKLDGVKSELILMDPANFDNTYELKFNSQTGLDLSELYMFGRFTFASNNEPMDPKVLEANIKDATQSYLSQINSKIQKIKRLTDGESVGGQMGEMDKDFGKGMCQDCSDNPEEYAACLKWLNSIGDFSYVGYTNINMYGEGKVFDYVVFMSRNEFILLQKSFSNLKGFGTQSQKAERLYQAIISQMKSLTGDPEDVIAEKTLDQIWNQLLNIPFDMNGTYDNLKNQKLKDIKGLNSTIFRRFLTDFSDKCENFTPDLYRNRSFILADQIYYWVPLKDFPGNNE